MKRGKDEEKVMGPLFPRLHVNDTEKGGPRAPPRNKMALYEQLSIPSQRFKPSLLPINSSSTANVIPPSSSQESTQQRSMLFPHQLPPSRQTTEKTSSHNFDSTAPLVPLEQNKRSEEDDFRVPIFMLSNVLGHDCGKNCNNVDKDRVCPSSRTSAPHPSKTLTKSGDVPRQMEISGSTVRQEARSYHNEELKEFVPSQEQSIKALSNSSSVKNNEVALKLNITSFRLESLDNAVNSCSILQKSDHEQRAACDPKSRTNGDVTMDESSRCKNNGNISIAVWSCNSEEQGILDDTEYEDRTYRSSLAGIAERGDDGSDTSMVDSVSGMEITPDDVVGIIGMKHFWKARKAIVNQQRVFAVQVFELHRLIKVQKLIATSPHLLLEDNSFLAKPIKASSVKKLPLEYTVKTPTNTAEVKGDMEKQNQKMECSAENTVGKASPSSVQNGSQMPNYRSFVPTSQVTSMNGDPNMASSWCFPQAQGHHQWLIPVMSPSEGLVYKPYPGPGYMAAACGGGCGPPVPMPMMGNLYNPTYGVPTSHHYQGAGVPPFTTPSAPHGYFPPYGMPVLNQGAISGSAEQMNHFASSGFHGKSQGVGTDVQNKDPSNLASPKHGGAKADGAASPDLSKARVSKESEMQASTASSPSERIRGIGGGAANVEGNNVLSLFPTSPIVDISDNDTFLPTRVIKVVPHNGRSATESAARIFQSIQEERKQFDTV